eukprot:TRINITY_DN10021_c0_g1_i2.p1 TRINITY_DN10021_c0_g1~~TRINITY_DN10021_c0_g1_i2.p1  ORF type:complete len:274 (-),score=77.51 TRINITY_DN10021_c0_g1_i2:309-1130(-)
MSVQVRLSNQLQRDKEHEASLLHNLEQYRRQLAVLQADLLRAEDEEKLRHADLCLRQDECRRLQQVAVQIDAEVQIKHAAIQDLQQQVMALEEQLIESQELKHSLELQEAELKQQSAQHLRRIKQAEAETTQTINKLAQMKLKFEEEQLDWYRISSTSKNSIAELQRLHRSRKALEEAVKKKDLELEELTREKAELLESLNDAHSRKSQAERAARVQSRLHTGSSEQYSNATRALQRAISQLSSLEMKLRDSQRACKILEKQLNYTKPAWNEN